MELLRQGRRGAQTVGLHTLGIGLKQPGSLQRVGCEYGRLLTRGAAAQQLGQVRALADGIEGIGIQHQARGLLQNRGQPGLDGLTSAASADHGCAMPVLRLRLTQHDFWPRGDGLIGSMLCVQQRKHHASRASMQCGQGGQPCGACHG